MVLGGFIDIGLRGTTNFDFLDFVPDLAAAVTAGFCFSGRRRLALGLPVVLLTIYLADPLSAVFVNVGGVAIPFVWMHALSIAALGAALLLEGSGRMTRTGVAFVGATVFASTMAAHAAGSILYENILVRVNHILTYQSLQGVWVVIFSLYPAERVLFTVLGTAISVPVLRALTRRMRQEPTAA